MVSPDIVAFVATYGDLAVFAFIFLSEIGVPLNIPNEVILIFAGAQVTLGNLRYVTIFVTALAADIIGATIFYLIFLTWGHAIVHRYGRLVRLNQERLQRFEHMFRRRAFLAVCIGRLIPYLRAYTSAAAGISKVPLHRFMAPLMVSSLLWVTIFTLLGVAVGTRWHTVEGLYDQWKWWLFTLIASAVLIRVWYNLRPKTEGQKGNV